MRKRAVTKKSYRDSSITKTAYIYMSIIWYCAFFNPIALRKAKIVYNFGRYECNRVKHYYICTYNSFAISPPGPPGLGVRSAGSLTDAVRASLGIHVRCQVLRL